MFRKILALSLGISLAGLLVFGAELFARREWQRQLLSRPPTYISDPILGFRLKPNYRGFHQALGSQDKIEITTTSQGFRDNQVYSLQKPPNTFRILVLGDSFVEGDEVALSRTFVKQLEQQLNSQSDNLIFQVINAGWRGSSTLQHYLWLKNEGFKFNPDLIILNFYTGNDINEANMFNPKFDSQGLAEDLTLKDTYIDKQGFLKPIHTSHCDLFYFCRLYLRPIKDKLFHPPPEFPQQLWQLTQNHLLAINQLTQDHQAKFLLSLTPAAQPDILTHQKLVDFATRSNIAFINLLPQFLQYTDQRLFFKKDPHWTATGHKLASQIIFDFLVANQFLP